MPAVNDIIDSPQNPRVKAWRALGAHKERLSAGLFIAEGDHMTGEALRAGAVETLLCCADVVDRYADYLYRAGERAVLLSQRAMSAVCDTRTPQGVAAVCRFPKPLDLTAPGARLLALDGVQDPGNAGTLLRVCDAAGCDGVLLSSSCADMLSPKALRATMGAVFRVPFIRGDLNAMLRALREKDYLIISSELGGAPFYQTDLRAKKRCLIVGSEGAGVSGEVSALAHARVALPMRGGAESLNAGVAGGIMLYDLLRRDMEES